eukprot:g72433.t1
MSRRKGVRCVETGRIFDSITAAGREMGVTHVAIHQSLRTGCKSAGFHWARVTDDTEDASTEPQADL